MNKTGMNAGSNSTLQCDLHYGTSLDRAYQSSGKYTIEVIYFPFCFLSCLSFNPYVLRPYSFPNSMVGDF